MARAKVDFDDRRLRTNVRQFDRKFDRHLDAFFDYEAAWATGYLKTNAPWTDRTGAARTGLLAVANRLGPGSYELIMSYSVHYGIWLEVANSGKYAIIGPSMRIIGNKILQDLDRLIERLDM